MEPLEMFFLLCHLLNLYRSRSSTRPGASP